jgi:SAM-dependent methyltransferase
MKLAMSARPCPVCASRDQSHVFAEANLDFDRLDGFAFASRKIPEYMHYRLTHCPACDVLYASPLPEPDALFSAYREAAFDSQLEARFASRTYGRLLPSIMSRLPDRHGALDIGTGDGAFMEELLSRGFDGVQGVEPSSAPIAGAADHIRPLIRQSMFRSEDYSAGSMSLVTCFQTIEHVHDPLATCRGVMRLLKPGGAFFLIGHNWRALSARILGRRSPIFDIEHLQLLSKRSAEYLLESAGYENVRVFNVFNRYPVHYWLKLAPIPRRLKARWVNAMKRNPAGRLAVTLPAGNLGATAYRPTG